LKKFLTITFIISNLGLLGCGQKDDLVRPQAANDAEKKPTFSIFSVENAKKKKESATK
jgi:hypothetical protein